MTATPKCVRLPMSTVSCVAFLARKGMRNLRSWLPLAAIHTVHAGRALGELAGHVLAEAGRVGQLVEAAPVLRAGQLALRGGGMIKFAFHQRWQPEQLCGGLSFQS